MFFKHLIISTFLCSVAVYARLCSRPADDAASLTTEKDLRQHIFAGYDKLVRPVKDPNTPVSASVSITPIVLRDVDISHHSMTMDSWMTLEWKDEYLQWNPEDFNCIQQLILPISEVWCPDISIYTGNSDSHHLPSVKTNVVIRSNGEVVWIPPFSIHNRCPNFAKGENELKCTISIMSWTFDKTQLEIDKYRKDNDTFAYFEDTHPDWKLLGVNINTEDLMFNCCEQPYSTVHFEAVLEKRT